MAFLCRLGALCRLGGTTPPYPLTGAVGGLSVQVRNYLKMNILICCCEFLFYFFIFFEILV